MRTAWPIPAQSILCSLFVHYYCAAYIGNQISRERTLRTSPSSQSEQIFAGFLALLLDPLAKMVPGKGDDAATHSTRRDLARVLFDAFEPRNAIEAVLAARAVAAHHASMDAYTRAAEPDISDEKCIRLRNSAIAVSRSFDAALRTLEKLRKEPSQPRVEAARVEGRVTNGAAPLARPQQTALPTPLDLPPQIPALRPKDAGGRAAYAASTAMASTLGPLAAAR
jgi:hypothetical protein